MKHQYITPKSVIIEMAEKPLCVVNGSYTVDKMESATEQTVGGDE